LFNGNDIFYGVEEHLPREKFSSINNASSFQNRNSSSEAIHHCDCKGCKFTSFLADQKHLLIQLIETLTESISETESIIETSQLINDSCNVALETLNDTLTFDKIDENMLALHKEEINPWKLVEAAAKPFYAAAI
jgi:hypothetical protein